MKKLFFLFLFVCLVLFGATSFLLLGGSLRPSLVGERAAAMEAPEAPEAPDGLDGLERFDSPGKGRGLRVTRAFQVGELLFSSRAYSCVLSLKQRGDYCESCFSRSATRILHRTHPATASLLLGPCQTENPPVSDCFPSYLVSGSAVWSSALCCGKETLQIPSGLFWICVCLLVLVHGPKSSRLLSVKQNHPNTKP